MKNIKYLLFAISILFLSSFCVDNTFCISRSDAATQAFCVFSTNVYSFSEGNYTLYRYCVDPTYNGQAFFYLDESISGFGVCVGSPESKYSYMTIYYFKNDESSSFSDYNAQGSGVSLVDNNNGFSSLNIIKAPPYLFDVKEDAFDAWRAYKADGTLPPSEPDYTYNDTFDDFKLSLIGLTSELLNGKYCMSYNAIISYPSLLSGTKYDFFEMGVKGANGEQTYMITSGVQHQFIDCNEFCNVGEKVYVKCTGYKGTEYGKTVCAIIDTSVEGFNIFTGTPVKPSFVVDTPDSDNPSDIISNKEYINILAQGNISYSYNTSRDYIYDINTSNTSYTEESYIINNVTNKGNEVTNNYIENIVNNTYNITYTYNYGDSDIDIPEFKNQFKLNFDKAFEDVTSYLSILSDYGIPQTFITTLVFGIGFISVAVVIKIIVIVIGAIL